MRTITGNWETDTVTTIYPRIDAQGMYLTRRQLQLALRRMGATDNTRLRYVPVAGATLDPAELDIR